jgi:hypothetical protein
VQLRGLQRGAGGSELVATHEGKLTGVEKKEKVMAMAKKSKKAKKAKKSQLVHVSSYTRKHPR